jgi:hypothetical protein
MATKRTADGKGKTGKSAGGKTDPEQVSGISAAAIEGASDATGETTSIAQDSNAPISNAEKMARPGPGAKSRRQS